MAKAIINGLMYDTEKAKMIYEFIRRVNMGPHPFLAGYNYAPAHKIEAYKTASGRFFEYDTDAKKITETT